MAGMEEEVCGPRNKATLIRTRKKKVVGEWEGGRKEEKVKKERREQQKGWREWCVFQQSMAVEARR